MGRPGLNLLGGLLLVRTCRQGVFGTDRMRQDAAHYNRSPLISKQSRHYEGGKIDFAQGILPGKISNSWLCFHHAVLGAKFTDLNVSCWNHAFSEVQVGQLRYIVRLK
jgi:hypothetical protein